MSYWDVQYFISKLFDNSLDLFKCNLALGVTVFFNYRGKLEGPLLSSHPVSYFHPIIFLWNLMMHYTHICIEGPLVRTWECACQILKFSSLGCWIMFEILLKSEQKKTGHDQKLAINKKSTIFVQSLWNLVKMINSWGNYFHQGSWGLDKNFEFLTSL